MRSRRLAAMLALSSAILACACQLLVGVKDEVGSEPPATPPAVDGGEAGDAGSQCALAHWPERPAVQPSGPERKLVFALKTIHVRPTGEPPIGYDLDDRCTVPDASPSELPCRGLPVFDDPGGLDNSFGHFVDNSLSLAFGDGGPDPASKTVNAQTLRGDRTILVFVGGYNGRPDDDDVTFAVVASSSLIASGCSTDASLLDAMADDAGGPPQWDGCDVWSYLPGAAVVGNPPSPIATARGWVRSGVLVVPMPSVTVPFGTIQFTLNDAVMTATLDLGGGGLGDGGPGDGGPGGGVPTLTGGIIAGRAPAVETASAVLRFRVSSQNSRPLCFDTTLSPLVIQGVCGARDIRTKKELDGTGICDAVSMGLGFEAVTARLGGMGNAPPDAGCPDIDASCP